MIGNSVNNGMVTGLKNHAGGFVGGIASENQQNSITVDVHSCANKGNISARGGTACGLFCDNSGKCLNVKTLVTNCLGKGNVKGLSNVCGISNNVTRARSVVSIGGIDSSLT